MSRLALLAAVAGLVVALTSAFGQGGLIQNGGFEEPKVASGTYQLFESGSSISGWTVTGSGNVAVVSGAYTNGEYRFPAKSGVQWLDMTGLSNSSTGVRQKVTTTPGASCTLSFAIGNVSGDIWGKTSTVDVLVDGNSIGRETNSQAGKTQVWKSFSKSFTATGESTTIEFRSADPSDDNTNGLDDVQLSCQGGAPGCPASGSARAAAVNEVRVVAVKPGAEAHRADMREGIWCPITSGMVLKQGDEISLDPDGEVELAFPDGTTLVVRNTTQLKIASFFTEGGVVRAEILLKMGEVAAQIHKSEATKSDFRIKTPTGTTAVRGTKFTVFYDPGSKTSLTSVREGVVTVNPTKRGLKTVTVRAGKEVEVGPRSMSKVARIGKAGARKGNNRRAALDRVLAVIAKGNGPCGVTTPRRGAFAVKPDPKGWAVSVKLIGKRKGTSKWLVARKKVTPLNRLAKQVKKRCA